MLVTINDVGRSSSFKSSSDDCPEVTALYKSLLSSSRLGSPSTSLTMISRSSSSFRSSTIARARAAAAVGSIVTYLRRVVVHKTVHVSSWSVIGRYGVVVVVVFGSCGPSLGVSCWRSTAHRSRSSRCTVTRPFPFTAVIPATGNFRQQTFEEDERFYSYFRSSLVWMDKNGQETVLRQHGTQLPRSYPYSVHYRNIHRIPFTARTLPIDNVSWSVGGAASSAAVVNFHARQLLSSSIVVNKHILWTNSPSET